MTRPVRSIAYFGQDATHSTVRKRIHAFLEEGADVISFTFRRNKINADFQPDWNNVHLGVTSDRNYLRRAPMLLRALLMAWRRRDALRRVDAFVARNFDQLAIAAAARALVGSRAPLVYESPDIQAFFTRRDAKGRVFRALERVLLRRVDLVCCSSVGFQRDYFEAVQRHPGPYFIWENKVLLSEMPAKARGGAWSDAPPGGHPLDGRWRIGWFGTLRCERSIALLAALARRLPEKIEVYSRGYPTETGLAAYKDRIAGLTNYRHGGEYTSPDDLAAMYAEVHFAWCFDFHDADGNSRMLLPNRLYEGGLNGVVMLAHAEQETGRYVTERDIGFTFSEPLEDALVAFFERLTPETYVKARERVIAAAASFADDGSDTRALLARIGDVGSGRPDTCGERIRTSMSLRRGGRPKGAPLSPEAQGPSS